MMNCKEARAIAIEQVRSGAVVFDPHFETCAECARFLQAQAALQSAFAVVPRDVPAPANIETKVMLEFDAVRRPAQRRYLWWSTAATLAALSAVAIVATHRPAAAPEPFVEIPYIAPLAPYERTSIVRMDVPVSALIAAGFDVHSPDTGAAFKADVLFGQDGRARAIRLVSKSNSIPIGD